MRCAGVLPGDGVIVPFFTACTTVAAILRIGTDPLFVDVEPNRPVLCPREVERLLPDSECSAKIRTVIEDCAQATVTL